MKQNIINTVGLFWRADRVFWGRPRVAGRLLGVPSAKKKADPVDFREQAGIYVLYWDYHIVYVGQTGKKDQCLFVRLRQHRFDHLAERWNQFSWFGVRRVLKGGTLSKRTAQFHPSLESALNHIEAVLIHAADPPRNGQEGRFGKKVARYLQVRDNELGPTDGEVLRTLSEKIDNPGAAG